MIAKLMKYDIKNMMRILVYIYAVSIGLSIITRILNIWSDIQVIFWIKEIFAGLTYSAVASVIINAFAHVLRVLVSSLYKDESYLTHTLPVKKSELILSKYLSGLIVVLCSVAIAFLSLAIVLYSPEFMDMLGMMIEMVVVGFNMSVSTFITIFAVLVFVQLCAMMSMVFVAVVKGNMYNSKRILKGLLWFVVCYMVTMWVMVLVLLAVFAIQGNVSMFLSEILSQEAFMSMIVVCLVVYMIASVVFYIIANKLFNKGVNVD